jgi:hypothetical protein
VRGLHRALAAAALVAGSASAQNSFVDLGVTVGHESNAPRAESPADKASDSSRAARLMLTRTHMLSERSGLTVKGALDVEDRVRFTALDNSSARLEGAYRRQPVFGYSTPWYEASGSAQVIKYRDSAIRDGSIWAATLATGRNLTDRVEAAAGAGIERRRSEHENLFDLAWRKAYLDLGYRLPHRGTLYARYTRIWGDQVFSVRPGTGTFGAAKAVEDDPAFGDEYYAYRLAATTNVIDAGATAQITDEDTVVLGASRFVARAQGGHEYADTLLRLTWVHRFQ